MPQHRTPRRAQRSAGRRRQAVRQSALGHGFRPTHHHGFTLVEMLVATALVLLMMSLFAQVFQLAGGTVTTQRGIAENDQRARSIQNMLKADLDKRTFRLAMPWAVGEDGTLPETNGGQRQGYLYISENDPSNDTDDVLQFTLNSLSQTKNPDLTPTYARAFAPGSLNWQFSNASRPPLLTFPNQPEADDGWTSPNGSTESPAAEVAYFVRAGKLYRRVLPLRQPVAVDDVTGQPTLPNGQNAFDPAASWTSPFGVNVTGYPAAGSTGSTTFWAEFDHSAFPFGAGNFATFHTVDDLSNTSVLTQFPLGKPRFRFGHSLSPGAGQHRPREFDAAGFFFGRYTHEETSHRFFTYPHTFTSPVQSDPMSIAATTTLATNGVFTPYSGGPRRGEDLLLSNVLAFDVKVWDSLVNNGAGGFVDIGAPSLITAAINPVNGLAELPSDYATVDLAGGSPSWRRLNGSYGPLTSAPSNRVFDTWYTFPHVSATTGVPEINLHPFVLQPNQNDPPPFRHLVFYPDYATFGATANAIYTEQIAGAAGSTQRRPVWLPSTAYTAGAVVFPTPSYRSDELPSMGYVGGQRLNGLRFHYRCVQVVDDPGDSVNPTSGPIEPTVQQWPAVAGGRIQDGPDANNFVVWEAVDNWKPLRALQLTVRFLDVTSNQVRQVTLVQSLID
jgi:prepilin-type N-terminal cleavage/methylation domain-containing protein